MIDEKRIAEIEERLAKATPGPWKWELSPANYDIGYMKGGDGSNMCLFPTIKKIGDGRLPMMDTADFIANTPTDQRYLLDLVRKLREELTRERTKSRDLGRMA